MAEAPEVRRRPRKAPVATLEQTSWRDGAARAKTSSPSRRSPQLAGRIAVRKAVAAHRWLRAGWSIVTLPLVEDSTNADLQPVCNPDDPPEAYHSSDAPEKEIDTLVYGKAG